MQTFHFDNRLINELPQDPIKGNKIRSVRDAIWSSVTPAKAAKPTLIAYSKPLAAEMGMTDDTMQSAEMLAALAGNGLLPGMQHYATRYGGHQFGHWAGQLGDGRAIFLGELINDNKRFVMQLKGAGETPYSRNADGLAVLRSSLREFLCSEAMHHLGVPTTRALSLVATGNPVVRDMFYDGNPQVETGAIVCRVAPSFTRLGHFQILANQGELDLLKQFIGFTLDRDFADWLPTQPHTLDRNNPAPALIEAWFKEVCERTAILIAEWMRVGFVHGVMNTDNLSILGLTIDYGPYGWVDNFDAGWTPNTTDAQGRRYAYGRQPNIARWNLERLAEALETILPDTAGLDEAIEHYDQVYMQTLLANMVGKFGLDHWQEPDGDMINKVFELMTRAEVDMTLFFTRLATLDCSQADSDALLSHLQDAFYTEKGYADYQTDFNAWLNDYATRIQNSPESQAERQAKMQAHNPRYVLRNYLAQQAIDKASAGDTSELETLLTLLQQPYTEQAGMERYEAKRPDWARHKAGCSMLSCSS